MNTSNVDKAKICRWILFVEIWLVATLGHASPLRDHRYTLSQIEAAIQDFEGQQLVIGYELGEVNWSQRTIQTLGAGTHMILSPTGGWGQEDLERLAIERARQNIERLSREVFRHRLNFSHCTWGSRSRMFHAPTPLWLSDGTIHLSAIIRFEMFEDCETLRIENEKAESSSVDHRAILKRMQIVEKSMKQDQRMIISLKLESVSQAGDNLACLKMNPKIYELGQSVSLPNKWRAVRWFWGTPLDEKRSSKVALNDLLKPSLELGSAQCDQRGDQPKVLLRNAALRESLDQALNTIGGAELWVWVAR